MNLDLIGLAFAAGMVAAFNPCGFAMLPAYLTLVVRRDGGGSQLGALSRALGATAAMAAGVLTVFGLFGLLTVSVASAVQRRLPYLTVAIGISLVVLGLWLLSGRELRFVPQGAGTRWAPSARLGSMFGVLAVAIAMAGTALVDRLRRVLPYVSRAGGLVMVIVGAYVAYYGWFELRLFDGAAGALDDPVIAAAGRVQRAMAGWVYRHGFWPWLAALGTLAAAAAVWTRRRRRGGREGAARLDSAL